MRSKVRVQAYVDSPELLDRVEGDDLLEEIVPIVTLSPDAHVSTSYFASNHGHGKQDVPCQKQAW